MPYSAFSIAKVKEDFGLTFREGMRFLPEIEPIAPSNGLREYLAESLPLAVATGSEKARSEGIIFPVLLEVRKIMSAEISLFSGEEFNVDESVGLNGTCDFLLSRSPELMIIEAPAIIIVEAKKGDLKVGVGQCAASMVGAQRFNAQKGKSIRTIFGCISSGTAWRFLKLEKTTLTIDFTDYPLPPIDPILGMLVWMANQNAEV
ncbi:MAG: hypothetical protein HC769_18030 [Cyanobacteria bacterium CRU_2_1]|nr:hypothetical protein [Cyanobacteria bacterium CRU_2_1]